jgi:acetyl-CoA carboxylase alpha subunit
MTPTAPEAALDWVQEALAHELRLAYPRTRRKAEQLIAIADEYNVPIEELLLWIQTPCQGKGWAVAEWRRYCRLPHRPLAA